MQQFLGMKYRKPGACDRPLPSGSASFLVLAANYVKFHEVRRAADEERRPRHDPDDIAPPDQMLFE